MLHILLVVSFWYILIHKILTNLTHFILAGKITTFYCFALGQPVLM